MSSRRALDAADRGAAAVWRAAFRCLGLFRPRTTTWTPPGGQRVLVIAPHPDDEALGCGGTIAAHVAAGDTVSVAIVTDGRMSRARNLEPDAMAAARLREAGAAARYLGVGDLRWFGLPEGGWSGAQLETRIADTIRDVSPDLIYAPSRLDYHPEHRGVAGSLANVVPDDVDVCVYTLHVPLGRLANRFVDVSARMDGIAELFGLYATQQASLERGLRLRRYAAGRIAGAAGVEEFWHLRGGVYRHAHHGAQDVPAVRGIRSRSFTDPLSYARGAAARRDLERLARRHSRV